MRAAPEDLSHADRLAVVTAGFGSFLAHGGAGVDRPVMRAAGGSEREAKVRVALLGGLEHGILAIPCTAAAIVLLVESVGKPPLDFTIPWAWRERLSIGLDATHLVKTMFLQPVRSGPALAGMLLYWLADMWASGPRCAPSGSP